MTHICVMSSHKPIKIYMGGLIPGVNTLYRLFCYFKLFPMVGKGLMPFNAGMYYIPLTKKLSLPGLKRVDRSIVWSTFIEYSVTTVKDLASSVMAFSLQMLHCRAAVYGLVT